MGVSVRVERIGDAALYQGDCLEIIADLGVFDTVITSPPYNIRMTTGGGFGGGKWSGGDFQDIGYGTHDDKMEWSAYEEWQRGLLRVLWSHLSDRGAIFYNHKPRARNGEMWLPLTLNPGLPLRQIIIWARSGGMNFSPTHYLPTHEWIMILAKEGFALRDRAASGVGDIWYMPQEGGTAHPAPFPVALPAKILETTPAGTVFDPFMGSGTTGVAATKAGRPFTGVEIDPKWFDLACRRIEATTRQPDMFVKPAQLALLS